MTGFFFHRWISTLLAGKLLLLSLSGGLLLFPLTAAAEKSTVLIIKSSDNSYFNSSVEQLIQHSPQADFKITTLDALQQENSTLPASDYIVTFGLDAANFTYHLNPQIPVIHSYLTEFQLQQHAGSMRHYVILLDQPLARYLSFIKLLLGTDRIGLIKNRASAIDPVQIQNLNASLGIELDQRLFSKGDNPVNMVRELLQKNDVLLSLPEPEVYNRNTLKGILLTAYRQNKPLISYSPSQVSSGALAAIYSSPQNIGRQIAALLNRMLQDKFYKPESVYFASEFDIKFNLNVARSLALELPDKDELLRKLKQGQPQ